MAPQATLMTTIAQGIFSDSMDWSYILIGVGVGVVVILVDLILKNTTASLTLPPLAVGMGIYLPPSLEMPLVMGSVLSFFVGRYILQRAKERSGEVLAEEDAEQCNRRGVLFSSGLIVGESLMGVIIAVIIVFSVTSGGSDAPLAIFGDDFADTSKWLGLIVFVLMMVYIARLVITTKFDKEQALAILAERKANENK